MGHIPSPLTLLLVPLHTCFYVAGAAVALAAGPNRRVPRLLSLAALAALGFGFTRHMATLGMIGRMYDCKYSQAAEYLQHGASPNARMEDGEPALIDAVEGQDMEMVDALLGAGGQPWLRGPRGRTAEQAARSAGDLEVERRLREATRLGWTSKRLLAVLLDVVEPAGAAVLLGGWCFRRRSRPGTAGAGLGFGGPGTLSVRQSVVLAAVPLSVIALAGGMALGQSLSHYGWLRADTAPWLYYELPEISFLLVELTGVACVTALARYLNWRGRGFPLPSRILPATGRWAGRTISVLLVAGWVTGGVWLYVTQEFGRLAEYAEAAVHWLAFCTPALLIRLGPSELRSEVNP